MYITTGRHLLATVEALATPSERIMFSLKGSQKPLGAVRVGISASSARIRLRPLYGSHPILPHRLTSPPTECAAPSRSSAYFKQVEERAHRSIITTFSKSTVSPADPRSSHPLLSSMLA